MIQRRTLERIGSAESARVTILTRAGLIVLDHVTGPFTWDKFLLTAVFMTSLLSIIPSYLFS
jgi:hypothetical protein